MSRLTRDGTAEPVSRDQIFRRELGQENIHFPCSTDHEQDWQPYPVDPSLAIICDEHTYMCNSTTVYVYVCMYVFIKLHITTQSGPVILVILCHSH